MSDFEVTEGFRTLAAWPEPQARRVHIEMYTIDGEDEVAISLNPEQAHDLIAVLRHVAQRRIPDDAEDGAADRAYDAYVDDRRGVL